MPPGALPVLWLQDFSGLFKDPSQQCDCVVKRLLLKQWQGQKSFVGWSATWSLHILLLNAHVIVLLDSSFEAAHHETQSGIMLQSEHR